MPKYWASEAARAAAAAQPSIAMGRKDRSSRTTNRNSSIAPRPCAIALAVCVALGLSACGGGGGGGGGNVKSNPPPTTPTTPTTPTPPSGSTASEVKNGETLSVANGTSVYAVDIYSGILDNAGTVGGPGTDVAVNTEYCGDPGLCEPVVYPAVRNHDGGRIEGKAAALRLWTSHPVIENTGAGSIIRSDGNAIEVTDHDTRITNSDGATISAGKIAITMGDGGSIQNGAGSTIETTGTATGDCFSGGSCSILVVPQGYGGAYHDVVLENAGTIIGNVQLDVSVSNTVKLWAGGTIRGDLIIDQNNYQFPSKLILDGGAGTTQRYSQAVTGQTVYHQVLYKQGEGTWILDNDALVLGTDSEFDNYPWGEAVQIDAGTLQVGMGGTEGPDILGDVAGNGRIVFDRSDDLVVDTSFHVGELVQSGTGLLTLLLPYNTFIGTLRIEDGRQLWIGNGAPKDPCCTQMWMSASIVNDGALTFSGAYDLILGGAISGSGPITVDGPPTLRILGADTHTGGTTINRGRLLAPDGLSGNVTVNAAGTLGGSPDSNYLPDIVTGFASVEGNLTNAGRVVSMLGDSAVGGDYAQSSTGTFSVRLGSQMNVAGTATLDGTLEIAGADQGYVANTHTEVLTAAGGVIGTFAQLSKKTGVVFTSNTINYDANSVWLDTTGLNITTAAMGGGIGYTPVSMGSAVRVQGAFEQLNDRISTDTLAGVSTGFLQSAGLFQQAASIEAAQASLRSLSGQLHAASAAMTFRAIDAGNQALSDHLDGLREGRAAFGLWTQQLGSGGGMARSGFDGLGFQLDGWLVGNDYRLGRSGVVGFAFGQGQGVQQLQAGADRDTSRRTEGMVYAGTGSDRWYAQGRLGFGQLRQDVNRQLLLGDAAEGVWTRYGGRYQVAYAESGLRWNRGDVRIAPFVGMEYARSDRDAFAEEGAGGFGLRSDAQSTRRWQASAGIRAARQWSFGKGRSLDVGAHAQWFRTLGTTGEAMDASFVGLQQWSPLLGIGLSRYGSLAGVGLDAQLSPAATLKLSYDYERGQYDNAHGMTAGVNVAF